MSDEQIVISSDSLEEAREQVSLHVTPGLRLVSERVISDGTSIRVRRSAASEQAAFSMAKVGVPGDASILEEKIISPSLYDEMVVEAFDDDTAWGQVKSAVREQYGEAPVIKLVSREDGSRGFLGIGRKPNQYRFNYHKDAVVELTYKPKAVIKATIGKELTPQEKRLEGYKQLAKSLSGDDKDGAIEEISRLEASELAAAADIFVPMLAHAAWGNRRGGRVNESRSDAVLELLTTMGEPARQQLRKMMAPESDSRYAVQAACIALAKLGDPLGPEARARLAAYVEGPDEYEAYDAITAMAVIGDEYVVNYLRLVALKSNPNELVRARAASALGVIGDKRAIPDLTAALEDPSWQNVRGAAQLALEQLS